MKKIIIAALTMLTLGATQAEYTLKIPLEQNQGGNLPNGSIQRVSPWVETEPLWGDWMAINSQCNFTPSLNTFNFTPPTIIIEQTCDYWERRTGERREINKFTGEYRYIYNPANPSLIRKKNENRKILDPERDHILECSYDEENLTALVLETDQNGSGGEWNSYWKGQYIGKLGWGYYVVSGETYIPFSYSIIKTLPSTKFSNGTIKFYPMCKTI